MAMNEFIGFNFLEAAMHTMADVRRGYVASPAAVPDPSTTVTARLGSVAVTAMHHAATTGHIFPLVGQS